DELPGGRVLAPTDTALEPAHAMGEETRTIDLARESDTTYPQRRDLPRDTYLDIPEGGRPWVAHVDAQGNGAVHLSTDQLIGRKHCVWGMRTCGRRWQDWLSPGGHPYIETQGGLAKQQSHYIEMTAKSEWSSAEAYGPLTGIESSDWRPA